MKKRPLLTLVFLLLTFHPSSAFAQNLKIVDFSYQQHFAPGETITFTVRARNDESTAQDAFTVIILTNSKKGLEIEVDSATATIPAGGTTTFTSTTTSLNQEGIYTVSIRIHSSANVQRDKLLGKFPIHIGNPTESISLFPEVIPLGTIPPGRTMFPTPIEVTWNFFRSNRLQLDEPFAVRIYTDNASRFQGAPHAIHRGSPAGLVSLDGRYAIPLKVWTVNFGPDVQETGWDATIAGPPPVDDDTFWRGPRLTSGDLEKESVAWIRVPDLTEMTSNPASWRRLIGQDPFDTRYVADTNPTGDFTITSPFTFYLAAEAGPTAVEGSYAATLVVELWSP